jgi:hypothetical protein
MMRFRLVTAAASVISWTTTISPTTWRKADRQHWRCRKSNCLNNR